MLWISPDSASDVPIKLMALPKSPAEPMVIGPLEEPYDARNEISPAVELPDTETVENELLSM